MYRYTILNQDGTKTVLEHVEKRTLDQLYAALHCTTVEVIPRDYWPAEYAKASVIYGDEEGRYNPNNKPNPHMKVLHDHTGRVFDVVGNVIVEERE